MSQSHDHFVRRTMEFSQLSVPLLKEAMSPEMVAELDFEGMTLEPTDFIDQQLKESRADLIFSIPLRHDDRHALVYTLFEHKSHPDPEVRWDGLRRQVMVMDQHCRTSGRFQLPLVIPLVLYHGKTSFPGSLDVADDIAAPKALQRFRISAPILLMDLSAKSDHELERGTWLGVFRMVLKHIHDRDITPVVSRLIPKMIELARDKRGLEFLASVIKYIISVGNEGEGLRIAEVIDRNLSREGFSMGTIAEHLKEDGRREAQAEIDALKRALHQKDEALHQKDEALHQKDEALHEALQRKEAEIQQKDQQIVLSMLEEGLEITTISRIVGLSPEELERIRKRSDRL